MDVELWKPVHDPQYAALYEVSSHGRVRRTVSRTRGKAGNVLRPGLMRKYYGVVLTSPRKNYLIHRLVLQAFRGPPAHGHEGCHNDGNPLNNHLDNLRWDTKSANRTDRTKYELANGITGGGAPILKPSQVIEIRKSREMLQVLAARFGVHESTISNIRTRRRWRWLADDAA